MKRALFVFLFLFFGSAAVVAQARPPAGLQKDIETYLRKLYAWGPSIQVKVNQPVDAELPGFYKFTVEVSMGSNSDQAEMYISKDGRHLVRGDVLDITLDPFAQNRRGLRVEGRPSRGPADARVTVVDFSDFECPHCKQLDQALRQMVSLYPQVRFVSKHYPLSQIHPWALNAAWAAECVFQLKPDAYWSVHDTIYDQQESITAENASAKLLAIATGAGLDPDAYRSCMVSPETKQAVETDSKEGQALRIANTPTVFVNGRRLVGGDPNLLRQYIEYELSAAAAAKQP